MIKIVFFGTPEFVVPILNTLHKAFVNKKGESPIAAVVTQKPKPIGRKKFLTYSAVDVWAHKHNLEIIYNLEDLMKADFQAEIGILAAYGKIIPKEIINFFPKGIINIHPSLLPKFRGASPIQAAIASGDNQTGVTILRMDEKMDHGPIISQFKEEILDEDTTISLTAKLFQKSAAVLVELLLPYLSGKIKPKEQDHGKATFTSLINKNHGFIPAEIIKNLIKGQKTKLLMPGLFIKDYSPQIDAEFIIRLMKAFNPWPGIWTVVHFSNNASARETKRLKILKAHTEPSDKNRQKLVIDEVQLEGKDPLSWKQFQEGHPKVSLI